MHVWSKTCTRAVHTSPVLFFVLLLIVLVFLKTYIYGIRKRKEIPMARIIEFPKRGRKAGLNPRDPETLKRIYADCRRRNVPYPLAVFDELDEVGILGARPGIDVERLRERE